MKNKIKVVNTPFISTLSSLVLLTLLTSCDTPRSDRRVTGTASNYSLYGNNNYTTPRDTIDDPTPPLEVTPTPGTTPTPVTIPSEVSHCRWSQDGANGFERGSAHLSPNEDSVSEGAYTLCQSSTNELDVYLQLKNPITDQQLCLIPTHHSGANSVYIGEPRCLVVRSNTSLYKITLIKNRSGFTGHTLNGVMMMKDKAYQYAAPFYQMILSPDAYIFCSQWLAQYGDPSYCVSFQEGGHYTSTPF